MINLITEHIDIWSAAQIRKANGGRGRGKKSNGQSPHGIKKVRELILKLAIRGKLVPQDPNDEPAGVLLEKIAKKKKQLIKEGKIKKQKKLPEISEVEKPFELFEGWQWARLSDCYDVRDGTHDSPKPQKKGYPLVTSKNLSSGELNLENVNYISKEDHQKILIRSKVEKNDILFAMIGSIGNPVIVNTDEEFSIKNVALFKYYVAEFSSPSYLKLFLELASGDMKKKAAGGVQSFVSLGKLRSYVIPVPPLAEQHRIVAKVDELMALCDQIELQQTDSIGTHQTLVETLLAALTSVADQDEFTKTWQQIADHFDILFTTEQSIDQLKQTILQLAVMGKLVPQDPNDEPASVLLEKIAQKKERLIKEGKIKKQKKLPEISEDEKPFKLPERWEWVRFNSIIQELKYGTSKRSDYHMDGDPVLRIPNVVKGYVESSDIKFTNLDMKEKQALGLKKGDLLIIRSNGSLSIVGRSAVVDSLHVGFMYAGYLVRVRFNTELTDPKFLKLILDSKLIRDQIELPIRTTSGVKNINSTEISMLSMPAVPIFEQRRIVSKVDELMAICDDLNTRLIDAQATQVQLADTIVEQAVA